MRTFIQRVTHASVTVESKPIAKIGQGLLVMVGFAEGDSQDQFQKAINKLLTLRLFSKEGQRWDASVQDIQGEILIISQFTLYADCKKGRRPDFTQAAKPDQAAILYRQYCDTIKACYPKVKEGVFGANMQVALENNGPVSLMLGEDIG